MSLFENKVKRTAKKKTELMSITEYLKRAKTDKAIYASPQANLLKAIGEPTIVDTSLDATLSRIFDNRKIKQYDAFKEFYGMEDVIEQIVSFLTHAEQGLEEANQILYLLGPVGSAKSSVAERLKSLMEQEPMYRLAYTDNNNVTHCSPVNDNPLCLFDEDDCDDLAKEFNIPSRVVERYHTMSPWAEKRLLEFDGDWTKFQVQKIYLSKLSQIGIAKTEPGDDNNADISALVGKVDIRMLEHFSAIDADAYDYRTGALNKANQGLMEFVEMFKAPIKMLNPLLTATQEGNFNATEGISALPFCGILLAHSNESEWTKFRNNADNEAFLDRVYIVKVPYSLRISEEAKIYKKLIRKSELADAPCVDDVYDILAKWAVKTRLEDPENSNLEMKMLSYNGQNLTKTHPKAKTYREYKDSASNAEGMNGMSTRFGFKILSKVFNFDGEEVAANPVHLFQVLKKQLVEKEGLPQDVTDDYVYFLEELKAQYIHTLGKEIQMAYLESYDDYGQNVYDNYVQYADFWVQDQEYRDGDTGQLFDRQALNAECEKIEKPAGISNPKDFRNEIVNFNIRARVDNNGKNPDWKGYDKLRTVIEQKLFSNTDDLLPVISFSGTKTEENQKKHTDFVDRMILRGYSRKQVHVLCEWYLRVRKSS